MNVNRISQNNNQNFTGFRFTKVAKKHIADTFSVDDIKELGKLVEEHKKVKQDVLVGTANNLLGSRRLRTRIGKEELYDNSLLFCKKFVKKTV